MTTTATPATTEADPPAPPEDPLATRRVAPRRRYGRWVVTAIVLALTVEAVRALAANPAYQWDRISYYFTLDVVLDALLVTLEVTAVSAVVGFVGGVILALGRLSGNPLVNALSWFYIWFFRSLPLVVLLIIIFNASLFFPRIGINIPFGPSLVSYDVDGLLVPFVAAVVGLSLNEAAFAAEIIRGGLLSVDHGQIEAANALGLSPWRRLRQVVLPQALRSIVPGYVNQLIGLVKASSLVYYVSLVDLFGIVYQLESTHVSDKVAILLVGTAWYLLLAAVLSVLQHYVERHYSRGWEVRR
ncbi:amino acid ABC transporter permease [Nocardioides luteus]|uniref:Polar amino acid ABC transporter permease n=1 Tax=Nocardioides luteus TaxID=1844 RepID=A0A1J4N092_9ACTN|nr:amino acid ABC transporter permease [Nocardioides luteus]OIJ24930.1 polar amino acid ABC transporter permease [Nocardioides luteus]